MAPMVSNTTSGDSLTSHQSPMNTPNSQLAPRSCLRDKLSFKCLFKMKSKTVRWSDENEPLCEYTWSKEVYSREPVSPVAKIDLVLDVILDHYNFGISYRAEDFEPELKGEYLDRDFDSLCDPSNPDDPFRMVYESLKDKVKAGNRKEVKEELENIPREIWRLHMSGVTFY
ncbi:CYFA0S26e01321g1_1 [Cyberlindnera fabianii]|uniref:CYFA0S26e01321g1_1 n=1 Tax=Cyberlindnera fabianii TaxID=36022 RepID=A0A061BG81_CYBFA|nr:CYFA0S26e01321g1_1 [Cyberlindnera fabianii]